MRAEEQIAEQTGFWWSFLLLGLVLLTCGSAAILLPSVSTIATGVVLGAVLTIVGIAKIVQAFETKQWPGFVCNCWLAELRWSAAF